MPDYAADLPAAGSLSSRPLAGQRIGVIQETLGSGVAAGVSDAFRRAAQHLESLGAAVEEVTARKVFFLCVSLLSCIMLFLLHHTFPLDWAGCCNH